MELGHSKLIYCFPFRSRIILFIMHMFIHYWRCCRSREQLTCNLPTTVMNCWSSVFNYWFRMVGMIVIVRIYSVSNKCTVLPWTIISMAEEKRLFIDFFMSNLTSRLAGSKWIMNNEPPTRMSSSFSRVKSSYVIYHSKLIHCFPLQLCYEVRTLSCMLSGQEV